MVPRVLTVAASDSSGAAGLQADLKTFEARQVYGTCAVTALTAQDSERIHAFHTVPVEFVKQQIEAVLADIGADAIKTGLLLRKEIVQVVCEALSTRQIANVVVDPVLVAGDGRRLVDDAGIAAYVKLLFPMASIITPNLIEAGILTKCEVNSPDAMREAACVLHSMGPRFVLVKGGHLDGTDSMLDILYDGSAFHEYRAERLPIQNARGTGCTFASCVAAEIAKGRDMISAVGIAKKYVTAALAAASDWHLGRGRGTIFHSTGRTPLFED